MDTLFWQRRYVYDTHGNKIEESRIKADGTVLWKVRHAYTYDAIGNWTQRVTTKWSEGINPSEFAPAEITCRTITYE
jgi:YD repeat-containing protein